MYVVESLYCMHVHPYLHVCVHFSHSIPDAVQAGGAGNGTLYEADWNTTYWENAQGIKFPSPFPLPLPLPSPFISLPRPYHDLANSSLQFLRFFLENLKGWIKDEVCFMSGLSTQHAQISQRIPGGGDFQWHPLVGLAVWSKMAHSLWCYEAWPVMCWYCCLPHCLP